jgi:coenzyme F420-reducing hydrogenase alpha subunit
MILYGDLSAENRTVSIHPKHLERLILLGQRVQQHGHRLAYLAIEDLLVGQPELSAVLIFEVSKKWVAAG